MNFDSVLVLSRNPKKIEAKGSSIEMTHPFLAASAYLFNGETLWNESLDNPALWSDFARRVRVVSMDDKTMQLSIKTDTQVSYDVTVERASLQLERITARTPFSIAETSITYANVQASEKTIRMPVKIDSRFRKPEGEETSDTGSAIEVEEASIKIGETVDPERFRVSWSQAPIVVDLDAGITLKPDCQRGVRAEK